MKPRADEIQAFRDQREAWIQDLERNAALQERGMEFVRETAPFHYSYLFEWMGRPVIQFPQDLMAMQELIWRLRPGLIVETGVAHGGSLVFYASMLELLGGDGRVVGIDVDIRSHNRKALEEHPMFRRIDLLEGSSTDPGIVSKVEDMARGRDVLVCLDSSHTHDHVRRELELYSPLVRKGGYVVVFDTVVEFMPKSQFPDRPWGPGDNPWTAVKAFLEGSDRFVADPSIPGKLLITVAPGGFLRCVKD